MVLWLGVGFVFGYALPRLKYFWSALGFLAIIAVECMYFAISTGNPFARVGALVGTRSAASRMVVPPFTYDDTGNRTSIEPGTAGETSSTLRDCVPVIPAP